MTHRLAFFLAVALLAFSQALAAITPAPTGYAAVVNGQIVTLRWNAPPGVVIGYRLEAGSGPGLANIVVFDVGAMTSLVVSAPPGIYYSRLRAIAPDGVSSTSNEIVVTVGGTAPPPPPTAPRQVSFSTTANRGWSSIEVFVGGRSIGVLTQYYEPSTGPSSCVPVAGARLVITVQPGTVTYSARSDSGGTWQGSVQMSSGVCQEVVLTCTNRDCSPAPPPPPTTPGFYVWGGVGYRQYLGYFTCTFCVEYGSASINNRYGSYGSAYSSTSIRNPYSQYGSEYSTYSACNPYASSPPRIYNASGTIYYGELTTNRYRLDAATSLLVWLQQEVCGR